MKRANILGYLGLCTIFIGFFDTFIPTRFGVANFTILLGLVTILGAGMQQNADRIKELQKRDSD